MGEDIREGQCNCENSQKASHRIQVSLPLSRWKNLNNITSHKQIRLCKDENLIELIFDLVPSEGYHGLVHHESFAGVYFNSHLELRPTSKTFFTPTFVVSANFCMDWMKLKRASKKS